MSLLRYTALAELRQQVRSHVFWIVFAVSLIMVIGASAIEALRLDAASSLGSGSAMIIQIHLIWTLFYLFTAAAFVGDAVIRDDQSRFAPIVRATPARRGPYVLGRFAGACAAVILCFLSVPIGLLASAALPAADPAWSPPLDPAAYAVGLLVLALPNLLVSGALFFWLASATRSLNGCFIGAVLLLVLYGANQDGGTGAALPPLLEPFGFAAAGAPGDGVVTGALIANRLLWLGLAGLFLWLGQRADRSRYPGSRKPGREPKAPKPRAAARPPSSRRPPLRLVQLQVRTAHELRLTMFTPIFAVLLALGMASAAATLRPLVSTGTPTAQLLPPLIEAFQLVPTVAALFFAGELMWSEQAHRVAPIVAATPAPPALLTAAKFLALALLLLALAVVTALTLAVLQWIGGGAVDAGLLVTAYVLPKSLDWVLFGILALFLQAMAPNKLAGWGLLVLFLIGGLALDQAGLDHPLYRYPSYPGAPLPPALTGEQGVLWYRLLWGAVASSMLAATLLLAGRRRAPAAHKAARRAESRPSAAA